jgi:AcrR family transcriptional regulator
LLEKEQKVDTKQKIEDMALELFKKISYSKTSVNDIANAVGINKATIYSYFNSKEDIIASLLQRRFEEKTSDKSFFFDKNTPFNSKLLAFIYILIDLLIEVKDLLFGSFENLKGKVVKEVFEKFTKYQDYIAVFFVEVLKCNEIKFEKDEESVKKCLQEYFYFIVGRILLHFLTAEWEKADPIKEQISVNYYHIFEAMVINCGNKK